MSRQIDLSLVAQYTMPSGIGSLPANTACVVAQAAIVDALSQGKEISDLTDTLECACPVLRVLAIALNDVKWWKSDAERTETLRPLVPLLLDSRRDPAITARRAEKASAFAQSAAKYAAESAKYAAKSAAEYAESAAKYAAEYAESAAEYAESAAKSAAKYAESAAKSAAEYAESAAKSAAEYAESAAEYAESAAEYAESAAEYAESAAKSAAKYAAEYAESAAKSLRPLRDELMRVWMECEAL